jgi:hypothetical protein
MQKRQYFKTSKIRDIKNKSLLKNINKDLFLRHQLISNIKNTFDLLGYDLESEKLYAVINRDEWKWQSTINQKYNRQIWNHKIKEYENISLLYDLSEHILKHCFPLELKNNISKKTNWISNQEDKIGAHYIEYDMCGSYLKENSNIFIIDIDCHDGATLNSHNNLYTLLNHFNNEYLYLERSYEGGYHLYIKLYKEYSLLQKREYLNEIKKQYNLDNIEIPVKMRFPFSYHYEPYTHNFEFVSIQDSLKNIKYNFDNQQGYILQTEQKEKSQKITPIVSSIYSRQRQSKIKHITPEEFLHNNEIDKSKEKINIFKGYRNDPMLKICQISNFNNWTNEETLDIIKQLDQGSKDLSKWSDNYTLKIIENMKNTCTIYYQESISCKPEKFISNIELLPDWLQSSLSDEQFIDSIIIKCKYKLTDLNRKKFTAALQEMFGSILYDCKNNRTTLNNKNKKYLIGKQFSSQYAQLMNKYYSNSFNSVDFHSIIKAILKYSELFSQFKSNSRGWNFNALYKEGNFCKQYDLSNNKNHILFLNDNVILYLIIQLLKSIFKYNNKLLIIQDFFNNYSMINNDFITQDDYLLDDTG